MRLGGLKSSFQAALLLLASAIVVFSLSRAISQFSFLPLYRNQFAFAPGDWFAWRLNDARSKPDNTCILVGASTVREGLDAAKMEQIVSNTRVVNLGTTGGHSAIDSIEIQARALVGLGDRFRCIVVGLHPMFLKRFEDDSFDLVTTDYAAVLPLSGLFDLARAPWELPNRSQLAYKYLMPLGQQAFILKRLLRSWLYEAHRKLFDPNVPRQSFEETPDEFVPQPQYNYLGHPDVLKDIEESYSAEIRRIGWDRASSYGGAQEAAALEHTLRFLAAITTNLVVLEMPQSHLFRHVDAVSRKPYEAAISASNVPVTVIRCQIPASEELDNFHDAVHLNEFGRARVSASLARYLQALMGGSPHASDGVCVADG
jgi:hypothetical protein